MVLKHRSPLQKSPGPVVICPDLLMQLRTTSTHIQVPLQRPARICLARMSLRGPAYAPGRRDSRQQSDDIVSCRSFSLVQEGIINRTEPNRTEPNRTNRTEPMNCQKVWNRNESNRFLPDSWTKPVLSKLQPSCTADRVLAG